MSIVATHAPGIISRRGRSVAIGKGIAAATHGMPLYGMLVRGHLLDGETVLFLSSRFTILEIIIVDGIVSNDETSAQIRQTEESSNRRIGFSRIIRGGIKQLPNCSV